MIYTVTFNPSLDYIVDVPEFELGKTSRTKNEQMLPGGKGINVSILLSNLGISSKAYGFVAGYVGEEIERLLEKDEIKTEFIHLQEGVSRINVKIKNIDGTEINAAGPVISTQATSKLFSQLDKLQEGDTLVLAGSIPTSMPNTIYMDIMKHLQGKNIKIVVDATKDLLRKVLPLNPFLIKPNHHELGEIFGVVLDKRDQVIEYAKKLQEMGAENVLVSMAGEGAVLVSKDGEALGAKAPKGTLINAVGAGDSMVAGFIAGYLEQGTYAHAFKMGVSSGSASAFSENLATKKEVNELYQLIQLEEY